MAETPAVYTHDNLPRISEETARRIAEMEVRAAAEMAQTWEPEPGESLTGVLIGSKQAIGAFGEQTQILVQKLDGSVMAVWLGEWLRRSLMAQNAELQDIVSISFFGKKTGQNGRPYNAMGMLVEKSPKAG